MPGTLEATPAVPVPVSARPDGQLAARPIRQTHGPLCSRVPGASAKGQNLPKKDWFDFRFEHMLTAMWCIQHSADSSWTRAANLPELRRRPAREGGMRNRSIAERTSTCLPSTWSGFLVAPVEGGLGTVARADFH